MKEQLRRGGLKFISFIVLDIVCLIIANVVAVWAYLHMDFLIYGMSDYAIVIVYMVAIDIIVTVSFNTLERVLRRRTKKELAECAKQVGLSFVILALFLFSSKQGAEFSRVTIFIAYGLYYFLLVLCRSVWKRLLKADRKEKQIPTALLITTSGYAREGLSAAENAGMAVKGIFLTDKTNEGIMRNIPTMVGRRDTNAFLCWEWIDKVYICGPDNIDVPGSILTACKQMGISVYTAPATKSLDFEVLKIRTSLQKNDKKTGLSFFESEHDVPFQIRRLYTIFESEQDNQMGYHAHKQSWHLLFCPYGSIDVMVDTGRERKTIKLSDPSVGLILHPSVWRELMWRRAGSVLCVAASGHYDADRLRNNYADYLKFLQEKEWSATIESAEIMGETIL